MNLESILHDKEKALVLAEQEVSKLKSDITSLRATIAMVGSKSAFEKFVENSNSEIEKVIHKNKIVEIDNTNSTNKAFPSEKKIRGILQQSILQVMADGNIWDGDSVFNAVSKFENINTTDRSVKVTMNLLKREGFLESAGYGKYCIKNSEATGTGNTSGFDLTNQ